MKNWKNVLSFDVRHRIASWLIGRNTMRAIYPGPKACKLQWIALDGQDRPILDGVAVYGPEVCFRVLEQAQIFTEFGEIGGRK